MLPSNATKVLLRGNNRYLCRTKRQKAGKKESVDASRYLSTDVAQTELKVGQNVSANSSERASMRASSKKRTPSSKLSSKASNQDAVEPKSRNIDEIVEKSSPKRNKVDQKLTVENLLPVFSAVMKKYDMPSLEGWYSIKKHELFRSHPEIKRAVRSNGGSLAATLAAVYPHHNWEEWKLEAMSQAFWASKNNRIRFFASIVPVDQLERWYSLQLSGVEVKKRYAGGSSIMRLFKGSLATALRDAFPAHNWQEWRFVRAPHGFWNDPANRKRFFNDFAEHHNIGSDQIEPWYTVTINQLAAFGGAALMRAFYSNSLFTALKDVYPDKKFQRWKFLNPHQAWWRNPDTAQDFLDFVAQQHGITKLEAWYDVSQKDLDQLGAGRLDLIEALRAAYPNHSWVVSLFKQRNGRT